VRARRRAANGKRVARRDRKPKEMTVMNAFDSCVTTPHWHDTATELRDFATSLTGDPLEGDVVMRHVLRRFRRAAKRPFDLDGLMGDIEALCLERVGCPLSADPEYVDPSDRGEDDDDESDLDEQDTEPGWNLQDSVPVDARDEVRDPPAAPLLSLVVAA
jgi:hypothetical protein